MIALVSVSSLFENFFTPDKINMIVRVALIIGIGYPVLGLTRRLTVKLTRNRLSTQTELLIQKAVYYTGILIIIISALNELGFKLSALLGAAGVLGIAIGFASQTSISNIISGIFLISEKPFVVGDTIQIGQTTGTVTSIDLLSVKITTSDNRFVRIPNETMLRTEIVTVTKFDTRRVNINVTITFQDDLEKTIRVLDSIAYECTIALKEPAHVVLIESFNDAGINILFGVWGKTEDYFNLKNALMLNIKEVFDKNGISISVPPFRLRTSISSPD